MIVLAIDTATPTAGAALLGDDLLFAEWNLNSGLTHSQRLLPMIEGLLGQSGRALSDIDLFAAVVGPGSFTGVRIGVSTVRALAHVLDKPVVAVDSLLALAYNLPHAPGHIVPILDARRDQVYSAVYRYHGGSPKAVLDMRVIKLEDYLPQLLALEGPLHFLGDGALAHRAFLEANCPNGALAPAAQRHPRASSAAQAALDLYAAGAAMSYDQLAPLYLRAPQAEREYEARRAAKEEPRV